MKNFINYSLLLLLFTTTFSHCSKFESMNINYDKSQNIIQLNNKTYYLTEIAEEYILENNELSKEFITPSQQQMSSSYFYFNLIGVIILTLFAGCMSGLTVGYTSIDTLVLEVKLSNGTEEEKYYAKKILSIVSNHHWLLTTLLLCNSFAAEAMPIVLHRITNEAVAIVLSVLLLLVFGEIVPMALCTGPNQMKIASYLCPLTYSLMVITYPLSYPIAIIMDVVIGIQGKTRYSNNDLRELIKLHTINAIKEFEPAEEIKKKEIGLSNEQVQLMIGALDIKTENVKQIMIPLKDCEMMEYNTIINEEFLRNLMIKGYSRIPIYKEKRHNIVGILRMKQLLGINPSEHLKLEDLHLELTNPFVVSEQMKAIDLLNEFRKGMSHMAFISNKLSKNNIEFHSIGKKNTNKSLNENSNDEQNIIGIVTLEDIIEKMFNVDILDEEDYKKKKEKMLEKEKLKRELSHKIMASFIKENKEQLNDMIEKSNTFKSNFNPNINTNLNDGDYGLFEDHNYFN